MIPVRKKSSEAHSSEDEPVRRTAILHKDLFTETGSHSPQTGMSSAKPSVSSKVLKFCLCNKQFTCIE